jgi:hypothetical protein
VTLRYFLILVMPSTRFEQALWPQEPWSCVGAESGADSG